MGTTDTQTLTNKTLSAPVYSGNGTGVLNLDNLRLDGNTISSTAGTDLNITPLAGQQIVLDGTIVIDAGVVTGATSITSTAFVGTLSTAAQPNITSLGTLTSLQVDNIKIDGNTLSAVSGAINITPKAGSAIVLGGLVNTTVHYEVDGTQVVGNQVVDARIDDAVNTSTWDSTTAGVLDAIRDACITHGLIAAS